MNKRRFFTMILALIMSISCLSLTASAEANPPSDDVIIWTSEPTEPQETRPAETIPPATEPAPTQPAPAPTEPEVETNAIVRDLMYHEETNKQFITVETRSGEVFYIIIDYDAPTDENNEQFHTYFLNKVDDADLQALLEDGTVVTCSCVNRCEAGAVNTACEICAKNMTECAGTYVEPEPTVPPTEPDKEPEEKTSPAAIVAVLLLIGLLGAMAFFFLKGKIPNTQTKGDTNLDDYDYGIEDDEEYADFEEYEEEEEK